MNPNVRDNLKRVLKKKHVLLGVSGSIAAFKAVDIVRFLVECEAKVRVILTDSAQKFVTPLTLETLSGEAVLTSMWEGETRGTHHIDTARWADIVVIAPATAGVMARMAHGMADDLLTTELLAFKGPVLVAPAMNPAMFAHPAVMENVRKLKQWGYEFLGPIEGETSCGEVGLGRMLEPEQIVESIATKLSRPKVGKRLLVTLGPTRSPVDPVRFITNRSSGKMGAAFAWAALREGWDVTVVSGMNTSSEAPLPSDARVIQVSTATEMLEAVQKNWSECDAFVGAAAVLDWDVANPVSKKIKKNAESLALKFKKNPDILAWVSENRRSDQFVLGFAAESSSELSAGYEKLLKKGCDAIFLNDISKAGVGFESDENSGVWIEKGSESKSPEVAEEFEKMSKIKLASKLFSRISPEVSGEL